MTSQEHESNDWNIWLTLMVISAGVTVIAGVLEALGVWHDIGVGVGFIGVGLTIVFGLTGVTKATVQRIDRRLDHFQDTLLHMVRLLEQLPERLAERLPK